MNRKIAAVAAMVALQGCATGGSEAGMQGQMSGGMSGAEANGSVMVGGAAMLPSRTIVQNAVNSKDHTTLVAAVQAAGLAETLGSAGPFTVFAPVNAAFDALPQGTVATLLRPENKTQLTGVLTYHVVPGRHTAADLMRMIRAGGGRATLRTVAGGTLTATMSGDKVMVSDAGGNMANVTIANVMQSNGVIHVVDRVLLPR